MRFAQIYPLYDQTRFLDAYQLCRPAYDAQDDFNQLDLREILLLARLARRLGGHGLARRLFQTARDKAPGNPLVIYYAGRTDDDFHHVLRQLEEVEAVCLANFENDADKAVWLGSTAWIYASIRDFERARRHLATAATLGIESAWVRCCEAEVLCFEDRWPQALEAIEASWALSPGMPQGAATLGRILTKLGRTDQAAARLQAIAQQKQSYELALTAIWYLCAVAERAPREENLRLTGQAAQLAQDLEVLAPLADAELHEHLALVRLDIAWLRKDRAAMQAEAAAVQHPFYQTVLANIEANPAGRETVTGYDPVFQKHNTCLPASVASVLGRFGQTIDSDRLADELTYNGTAAWRMLDWLKVQGLRAKAFIVDGELARRLIQSDLPFVVMVKSIYYYHAMAAVGVDEAASVLLIHDPSSTRLDKVLLTRLGDDEGPFGLEAIAVVPPTEAHRLSAIPEAASAPYSAFIAYQETRETAGLAEGRQIIEGLRADFPEDPFVTRLEGIHLGLSGRLGEAIEVQEQLLARFPDCEHIRQELLANLYRTGNRSRIRKMLSRIVFHKRMPGIRATQQWHYPPAEYVSQYASYVGMVKTRQAVAAQQLYDALGREPSHAASYHVLGDLRVQEGDFSGSTLPFRCAALLELENHHYARAYLDALAKNHRLREGFEFLKARTDKLGDTVAGGEVWSTLIDAYEDYGYPDEAVAGLRQALCKRPRDAWLLAYAVGFWGRMGFKAEERESLAALQQIGHRPAFLEAATAFYRSNGDWATALTHCEQWSAEQPHNLEARRALANLCSLAHGMDAALDLTRQWMADNPDHDGFEMLHYDFLKALFMDEERLTLLRNRIKRNTFDTWGLRELAFALLHLIDLDPYHAQGAIRGEIAQTLLRCRRLSPHEPVLFAIRAEAAALAGRIQGAIDLYLKAVHLDPEYSHAFQQAWYLSGKLQQDTRKALFAELEQAMFKCTGFLNMAKELVEMAAECFGSRTARSLVDRWQRRFPDDPEIIKAKARLLLYHGQGRSDAERAVGLLEAAMARFPHHADFKFLLSRAHRILRDQEKWVAGSLAILKQFPLSSIQRRQLADYYQYQGELARAEALLREGVALTPLDGRVRYDLIDLLFKQGKKEAAADTVADSLAKIPEDVGFRGAVVELLFDNGLDEMAVSAAEGGTRRYPRGAVLWKEYGDALWRSSLTSDMEAVAAAYRRSLACNARFFDAADRLARLCAHQKRFDEARRVMAEQQPYAVDQCQLLTRLAWIDRMEGKKSEAFDQVADIVKRFPKEAWPWRLLLEWIKADENWEFARRVLGDVPPVLEENPDFACDKLFLLHKAGVDDEATRAQWARLLHDFPENEKIHCLRFDILYAQEKYTPAGKILAAIEKVYPDSPYLLARKVALKADLQEFDAALAAALALMQLPADAGDWCRHTVRKAFKEHNQLGRLVREGLGAWRNGAAIGATCFEMLVADTVQAWPLPGPGSLGRLLWRIGIEPQAVKQLKQMLATAQDRDNPMGSYTAAILSKLEDFGLRRYLFRFAKKHAAFAETRTKVWQIIGHALATAPRKKGRQARRWMARWQAHPGCELWVVTNYLIAIEDSRGLGRERKLRLILATAREAVRTLPTDHTLQFVVGKYAEAALRLGMDEDFLAWTDQYASVLEDTDSGYWKRAGENHQALVLLKFRQLLRAEPQAVPELAKLFKKDMAWQRAGAWVMPAWRQRVKRRQAGTLTRAALKA